MTSLPLFSQYASPTRLLCHTDHSSVILSRRCQRGICSNTRVFVVQLVLKSAMFRLTAFFAIIAGFLALCHGQPQVPQAQVKISDQPFPVANAQQLNQVVWTVLGTASQETIYCVSEAPVSQLRFVCIDCLQRNITDMVDVLSSAQDLTRSAGFPTVSLRNVAVNPSWTGAQIMCQAALNGATIDSAPAVIDVRYLRQPHVVDQSGQGPILLPSQGYRFYVECVRGSDGTCQPGSRRKTLRCAVQAHPPATVYRWLRNGVATSSNGAELTIGTEMIGQSIQCQANNGLYSDSDMPSSQAVQIDPYTAARLVQDNFQKLQSSAPFQAGNRIEMNQQFNLGCQVEGNPRPLVFWKLRRPNGQVVDAPCPQGFEGQYQEAEAPRLPSNIVRLNALCALRISNYSYSGQYWCSACSYVSQGTPECSPSLDAPGQNTLSVHVQGPPMQSETPPTIEQTPTGENAVVSVHFCAEPAPRPPREIVFSIDQNDLHATQSWKNFAFEGTSQNNTVPNCYSARLRISSISDDVQSHQVVLKLTNQYGQKHISVPLDDLLGGNGFSSGELSGWVIGILVLIALLLAIALIIACCVRKHLFCFNQVKSAESTYTDGKPAKSNLHVHENYSDDMNGHVNTREQRFECYHGQWLPRLP
ncbi:hypothetical protein L596_003941 [Steinernema carpocapsae]|uniref:Ig-like domain-containing protein n=1 Tax=Steinernema carpocapsae TaxID=34508 RepID=A0A4U8UU54_STECR|nr:hypothetical protein L596_003941 [Steinernema carpocapsae]